CRYAAVNSKMNNASKISSRDFATGLKQVKPSITKEVDQWYNTIRESISNVVPKKGDNTFYG
ncbi:MAG: hypothetical protein QMC57_04405, partial [Nitrosopumilus sp.]